MHFERCEIVAEDVRVCIVTVAVTALPARLRALTNTVELLRLGRPKILTLVGTAGPVGDVVILILAIDLFLEVLDPFVDLTLGLEEAFLDALLDYREIIWSLLACTAFKPLSSYSYHRRSFARGHRTVRWA
jgi:hypothetical protein